MGQAVCETKVGYILRDYDDLNGICTSIISNQISPEMSPVPYRLMIARSCAQAALEEERVESFQSSLWFWSCISKSSCRVLNS
jgi:hypothetical protein